MEYENELYSEILKLKPEKEEIREPIFNKKLITGYYLDGYLIKRKIFILILEVIS